MQPGTLYSLITFSSFILLYQKVVFLKLEILVLAVFVSIVVKILKPILT
ncbi:hypothetical protein DFR59_11131 [Falsibacillus pallidus]|uniref:Uncharacterized protein n=1 Tax=Falsibacillus pallidus TaxID=493781 RepID=A0A370GAN3_9BACI|nr:hypothetical protein DFR59_11131 [Falsibacillus pallidus]